MAPPLTDKERKKILAHLEDGKSNGWIAKEVGRSKETVRTLARKAGIDSVDQSTKKATRARRHFAKEDRLALIGYALDRGGEFLDQPLTPQQYQQVMTGIAIGIDKHRLETGDVTDRTEKVPINIGRAAPNPDDQRKPSRRTAGGAGGLKAV